ncbi:unnamed protein product [Zymoseptoria tritici ST99CH_1A5]|uniref:Uncharacterized protein n=1 Tax=Zymoseptoria tritici ST99CH_1A5 TaxID=1276529 RepID=A0A1Y6LX71_ZYMTR|nr:unnamed protein product [Zymoseptoria tritici ST99CH_1A5]
MIRGTGDGVAQEVSVKNSSHKLTTDAYPAFGGKDAAPSPLHFNLTSLSSCTQVTGSLVAKDLGLNLGKWDVEVAGHLDPSVLTQGVEGNANWKAISLKVRVDAEASKVDFEKFASETERRCPVTQLLSTCKTLDHVLNGSELLRGHEAPWAYLLHMQANTTHNLHDTVIEQVPAAVGRVMDEVLGQGRDKMCRYDCTTPADVQKVMANIARATVVNQHPVPSIWPFVEHMNVYMMNEFLATGLTLVDTPGLGDENLWVQLTTDTAMTNAGMMVLVHDHARPNGQAVLDQAIPQCVNRGKISTTIMVLTKMDEITVPPEDDRTALSVAQLNRLQTVEQAVADCQRLFTEATRAPVLLSEDDDASAAGLRAARATKDAALKSLSQARRERTACAINIFIDKHRNLLREKVDDPTIIRKRALKVIHISNKQYFSADPDAQVPLADTGIPRLRAELWRFAHKDHLSHLKSVMRQLSLALLGIDAVLNHAPSVRKESMRPKLRDQLDDEPELSVSFFQDLFNAHAAQPMLASSASYTTGMIDVIDKFPGRFKAQTIMTLLKKDGVFKPKVFSDDAFQWWDTLLACYGTAGFKKYEEAFETHFEDVCSSMSELGVTNGFDPTKFNAVVGLRAQQLDAEIRAIWNTFIGTTDALDDNLMGYRAPNLLQLAHQPAYADASKIIGQRKGKPVKAGFTASTGKNVTKPNPTYNVTVLSKDGVVSINGPKLK